MAVSKSLRYQILRRDNHTCRYCGATAPDVVLRIDHVVATTLGGSDDPSNLVAACHDCNAGKSATPADAALVADVAQDALRWARAMEQAAEAASAKLAELESNREVFDGAWNAWHTTTRKWDNAAGGHVETPHPIPREAGWERSVDRWIELGLTIDDLKECIRIAMRSTKPTDVMWKWFCGIAWKTLSDRQERVRGSLAEQASTPVTDKWACGNHPPIDAEVRYAAMTYLSLAAVCDDGGLSR